MTGSRDPFELRIAAREIFDETLRAVNAADAVRRVVRLDDSSLKIGEMTIDLREQKRIYAISIGKAALAMVSGLHEIIGDRIGRGIITCNLSKKGDQSPSSSWLVFAGGHPEPNEQSLAAAQACFDLLARADEERALVVFLLSGGGSAMIEWPLNDGITLADLQTAHKVLVNSGASIGEINAVRRAFSAVKGGRLAARAPHCDQVTLIVSDVPPGDEENVASGPTLPPPAAAPDVREVIARYDLSSRLPDTVLRAIDAPAESPHGLVSDGSYTVLLDNQTALTAAAQAARRRGFEVETAGDISDQPIEEGCAQLGSRLEALRAKATPGSTVCLISGGEFACPVRGDGLGGRNLETALRLAVRADSTASSAGNFIAVCAGTDGIDGNSPAAGAIVDDTTLGRARAVGLDPQDFLSSSDAYSFFVALGDVVATGATGTNVRDIRILLTTADN